MKKLHRYLTAASALLLIALFVVPSSAFAHERRTIGNGKYDVVVGWDVEPAYEGLKNGASIRISEAGSNPAVPVQGAEKTVKVQIRQGATTKEFLLRSVFGQPGYYVADILPTRAGDYQWTFVGTIGDTQINATDGKFDTADGKFNAVEAASGLEFPQALPDPVLTSAALSAAQADAQGARTLALAGIGAGVLGLVAAAVVWLTRPRPAAPARRTATEQV
ncbi:MAG: hypothetical protein E6I52_23980 [Chloroflexi bacterium]|nr:MAG: hypothetical protein E6I52_23980 [Chloroflexota bacterium]